MTLTLKTDRATDMALTIGGGVQVSDGHHTFDELYDHRITLYVALCRELSQNPAYQYGQKSAIWRTRLHSDGSAFNGWFVLGIGEERGQQITYHLPDERWNECAFAQTLDRAPDFDGHASADVLQRLKDLG